MARTTTEWHGATLKDLASNPAVGERATAPGQVHHRPGRRAQQQRQHRLGHPEDLGLEHPLAEREMVVLPPTHRLAGRASIRMADLAGETFPR
ncbi:hypothetical protein [Microbispora sp. KK1-11]|uniref:hypothetical protein n=1 Tax=Microbispora sp. KK1-11 TaxID=2053005 RepID=UPI00163CA3E1|nr:hypothetical protein [Microbispora sp. KK1-11]